jgi:hypothetical protein
MPNLTPPNGTPIPYRLQPTAPSLQEALNPGPVLKQPDSLLNSRAYNFNVSQPPQGAAVENVSFSDLNIWDDFSNVWNQANSVIEKWSNHTFTPSQPAITVSAAPTVAPTAPPKSWSQQQYSKVSNLLSTFGQRAQQNWNDFSHQSSAVFNTVLDGAIVLKDKAVNEVKTFFNHIYQFSQGTAKEKQANCGPASAFIIGENFGLDMPSLSSIRASVGAPRGNGSGAFAITTGQLGRAVTKQAEKEGRDIRFDEDTLGTNVDSTLRKMRENLAAGKKMVLLTSNIASGSQGHYVVINKVNPDGSIEVSDPQSANGAGRVHSRAELEKALKTRANRYGLESTLITFEEKK